MNTAGIILLGGCIILVALSGCTSQTAPVAGADNQTATLANPASVKCLADGGQDKILTGPNGQYGLCLFPDGTVCEEWAYYRGECLKGQCWRKCEYIGSRSEGWYDCRGNLLFWDNCTAENFTTAGTC